MAANSRLGPRRLVGRSETPIELRDLTLGAGRFLADIMPADGLRAVFVRSLYAHGRVRGVSTADAAAMPGVVAVLTASDLALPDLLDDERGDGRPAFRRPILAGTTVRYSGEAVAVIVAEDQESAADAIALVGVDVDPLQVVIDPRLAATDEVVLFPDVGTNVVKDEMETLGAPPSTWPMTATVEVYNNRLAAVPIETLGLTAIPGPGRGLTVWCGHQAPHLLRDQLARILGLDPAHIRVRVPDVGGAFGLKGVFHPEYAAVAAAAMRLNRPVTWLAERREEMLRGTHGRDQVGRITLSGEPSGRIRRADVEILADVGAYPHHGGELSVSTRLMATGPYDIPEITLRTRVVVTSKAPIGPYRGAGRPEAAYLLERGVDAYARAVGVDPAEVRRLNFVAADALPRRTPTGAIYDGGDYRAALDEALRLADADAVRREQAARRERGQDPIGLGIGVYMDRSGGGIDNGEYSRVEIGSDGAVVVRTGSTASGQSHAMIWRQVVADALSVAPDTIRVIAGDTGEVAQGVGTFGSRSTQLGAAAAGRAATRVVDKARLLAADRLEASADDLVLGNGGFRVAGVPGLAIRLADIAATLEADGTSLAAEEYFVPGAMTFPYGVFVAVVGVDMGTGTVHVRHIAAVNDCGRLINPRLAADQVVGSILQGLGQALLEEIVYDEWGQLTTSTLADYLLPTAANAPRISVGWIETPAPSNPLGAKGIGESGCVGVPQAVVNGALDALAPWNVTDLQMPLSPDRVWQAIRTASRPG